MSNRPVPPSPIVVSYSVLGSERMLAASVDYRHGLADVMQWLSSVVYSLVRVTVLGSERMLAVSVPAWAGRCKAVWLSVQWFTHCGPVLQCWVASGCWQPQ
ncbi:hypothetical protein J6590_023367 [Homalodisca vitripennis]|nr:hypothetical protein J6590_023367 [Homalodisca vitripennis]